MNPSLKELYQYRELLWRWILREISVRYKQSLVGAGWAILQPLAMMTIFTVVFSLLARVPTNGVPYPVFAYTALLPWTFLQTSVTFGVPSLVNNLNLVTKIYFPREILPLGAVGASYIDFMVASTVFIFMLLFFDISLSQTVVWVPLLLILQVLLAIGVTLLGSGIIVRYRDVRFVVPLILQVWLFATPIVYPVSLVPEDLRFWYMLNPMAGIVTTYRRVLLHGQPPIAEHLGSSVAVTLTLFVLGYSTFKRLEADFADVI